MSEYPKALQEFLNTVPKQFKKDFDILAQTKTGKRVVSASENVDAYFFNDDEKRKNEKGGQARINDDNKLKVMMTKGYMNDVNKNSLFFAYILMHELGHVEQMENISKAKEMPLTKELVYNRDEKEKIRNVRRECDADRKALDMVNEAGLDKNTEQFKQVDDFLTKKYGNDFDVNLNYEEMTDLYCRYNDKKIRYRQAHPEETKRGLYDGTYDCPEEHRESVYKGWMTEKDNYVELNNDSEVKEYETMMLTGEKSEKNMENLDFSEKNLSDRKLNNSSRRDRLAAMKNGTNKEEVKTVNPLSRGTER